MARYSKGSVASEVQAMYRDRNHWTEATIDLEFKSGKDGLPKSIWESYSAFANTDGGYIMVGVSNDGQVEGIDGKAERYRDEFINILSAGTKCDYTAGIESGNIAIVELDGKEVLAIRVKAATAGEKPVCLERKQHKSYVRCLEGDRRCTPQELARMIRDRDVVNSHYTADAEILPRTGVADLDAATIRQYREDLLRARHNHVWGSCDDATLLTNIGAYRMNRASGQKGLTLAGLLMFGRTETIMELHPRYSVDYFELDGSEQYDTQQRWVDRITVDGSWAGNLYQFYKRVWPRLTEDLKRPFRLGAEMKRLDDSTTHEAVREALANAIIHADYLLDGGIQIYKRPNGLTFINAGSLLLSEKEIFTGHNSRCRNRNLQKMFKLAGIVDEAGTGVDKIMRGWFDQFLSMPDLEEDKVGMRITWNLPYVSMLSKSGMAAQRAYIGSEKYNELPAIEKIILLMIPGDRYVSNADLRQYLPRLHSVDLGRILSRLREAGYLESRGRSNAMKYTLAAPLASCMLSRQSANASTDQAGSSVLNDGSMVPNGHACMVLNEESSVLNGNTSTVLNGGVTDEDSLVSYDAHTLAQKLEFSEALQEELQRYRQKQRHSRQDTDDIVLKLCQSRHLTILQLSILLDRTPKVIRRDCIAPLVRHGRLVHKEEKMTHKNQAYKTAETDGEKKQ